MNNNCDDEITDDFNNLCLSNTSSSSFNSQSLPVIASAGNHESSSVLNHRESDENTCITDGGNQHNESLRRNVKVKNKPQWLKIMCPASVTNKRIPILSQQHFLLS